MLTRLETRFWTKARLGDDCWMWSGHTMGGKDRRGYFRVRRAQDRARLGLRGSAMAAHRVAWALTNGPIPDGLLIRHSCDNGLCVRPSHLLVGTQTDNMRDAIERDRFVCGEDHVHAKVTAADVRVIRSRYAEGDISLKKLGSEFGIDATTVRGIVMRRKWRHID